MENSNNGNAPENSQENMENQEQAPSPSIVSLVFKLIWGTVKFVFRMVGKILMFVVRDVIRMKI